MSFTMELCLAKSESVDDELALVMITFELLLVGWCKGGITTI